MNPKNILIVEDHPLMRTAIKAALDSMEDVTVTGEACSVAEGKRLLFETEPDLMLLDLYLSDGDGQVLIELRNKSLPNTRILVITSASKEEEILAVLKAGVDGFIGKDSSAERVRFAVREVLAGRNYVTEESARLLLHAFRKDETRTESQLALLSPRKVQILELLANGATNKEIARELVISESTVRSHLQQISQTLGLVN